MAWRELGLGLGVSSVDSHTSTSDITGIDDLGCPASDIAALALGGVLMRASAA
tara:strand:+ start:190 stop:348 length:159 start_codon:yes stop_codon:yes gene_type:complete